MLRDFLKRVKAFESEAHGILAVHEGTFSRVVILEKTYDNLTKLSLKQDDLLRQALRCAQSRLFRAAHVMAWAAFMDFFEDKLASDSFKALAAARPAWKITSIEDLRESTPEYQLIEAGKAVGLCTKNEMKGLHGLLNKRNECAHPSDYYPGLNETLGFISEVLKRIEILQRKTL